MKQAAVTCRGFKPLLTGRHRKRQQHTSLIKPHNWVIVGDVKDPHHCHMADPTGEQEGSFDPHKPL